MVLGFFFTVHNHAGSLIKMTQTLLNENCMPVLETLPDESINLIFCDLPYGISANQPWDTGLNPKDLFMEYKRILTKDGVIVLTATEPFRTDLILCGREMFKYDLIWMKNKSTGFLNAKKQPMRIHESILVFAKNGKHTYNPQKTIGHKPMNKATRKPRDAKLFGDIDSSESEAGTTERYPISVLAFPVVNNDSKDRIHPSQKPDALCEWVIKTFSNEGEVVLDNCMGSGSAIKAAKKLNRQYIGIEQDKDFFDKASKNINQ